MTTLLEPAGEERLSPPGRTARIVKAFTAPEFRERYPVLEERGTAMIRKTYIRKVEGRLGRLEDEIDHLRKRIAMPMDDIGSRIDRETRDLRSKAEAVRGRIRAVGAAGASNWGNLKKAVDEGLKELGQAVDKAVGRIRKTGSGDN
jgi:hypothetical protein